MTYTKVYSYVYTNIQYHKINIIKLMFLSERSDMQDAWQISDYKRPITP